MTSIKIFKEFERGIWNCKYKIMFNGENVGEIKSGQTVEIPVKPGPIELYVKINWCRSNKITFFPAEGEQVQFRCSYRKKRNWYNIFHATYYLYFRFDQFLILEKVDDLKEA